MPPRQEAAAAAAAAAAVAATGWLLEGFALLDGALRFAPRTACAT